MSTYAELKARHRQDLFARLPEMIAHIGWSQEQLRVERERRLRELIDTAVTRSTWHRARLSGLGPATITADTLAGVPTMTKDDLLEHFDDIVTDPRLRRDLVEAHLLDLREDAYLLDRYHAFASGGSSGRRGVSILEGTPDDGRDTRWPGPGDLDEFAGDSPAGAGGLDAVDEQLIARLAGRARAGGLALTGEAGLLAQLTKRLVESALEGEITDHLGYDRHDAVGRDGGNSRNGHRSKTVLTEVGPVQIDVPRDREATFEPRIVGKRKRRLSGVDELVISLSAKGLTTGEVAAHLGEVYGADVSRQTISTITDRPY
jgi:putative transposase